MKTKKSYISPATEIVRFRLHHPMMEGFNGDVIGEFGQVSYSTPQDGSDQTQSEVQPYTLNFLDETNQSYNTAWNDWKE